MTDERLLDFDASRLADFDRGEAERALAGQYGDLYRNHLAIAQWIDGWIERMAGNERGAALQAEGQKQFEEALREVAAHLRQGDFLPDGALFGETLGLE